MNPEWIEKYPRFSQTFMEYGWFVAPFLIGAEFRLVEEVESYIANNPPSADADRKEIEDRIYKALLGPVFEPGYRARATWYGNQLEHLKPFNHLYEAAIFSYYKRDYPQSVLCLLAALEGVLLSYAGFQIGVSPQKPSIPALISRIRETPSGFPNTPLETAHNMYRDTLANFLENWIYRNTSQSDFSISVLNRHYVLHGMDAGNFYRPHDLHRLILAFDLLIEFLAMEQAVFHTFLPDPGEDEFIDYRRKYYRVLAHGDVPVALSRQIERKLLEQHSRYEAPAYDPNLAEHERNHVQMFADILGSMDKLLPTDDA